MDWVEAEGVLRKKRLNWGLNPDAMEHSNYSP
jgi:hypothetical protein